MMGWYDGHSGFGPGMWLFMVVFWIALIALIIFLVLKLLPGDSGTPAAPPAAGRQESPEEILDRMFALGEIDEQTYRSRRSALAEMRRPS